MIYCEICEGGLRDGTETTVPACVYRWTRGKGFETIYTGSKRCPGCDGSGISEKAKRLNVLAMQR